jgi:hypothetical protein
LNRIRFFYRKFKKKGSIRLILASIFGLVFFCLLLVIPAVAQFLSFPFRDIDPLKSQTLIDKAVSMLKKCERKSFITMNDWIFLGISIILTIILFLSVIITKQESTENWSSSRRRNRNSQLERKKSSRTKQQKDLIRHKSLDKEPQIHESVPLLEVHSSAETAQPSIDTVQQSDGMAQQTGEVVQLIGGMAQQTGGIVQLISGTAPQSGGMAQQTGRVVQLIGGMAQQTGGIVQLISGTAPQSGGMAQQSGRVIPYTDPKLSYGI